MAADHSSNTSSFQLSFELISLEPEPHIQANPFATAQSLVNHFDLQCIQNNVPEMTRFLLKNLNDFTSYSPLDVMMQMSLGPSKHKNCPISGLRIHKYKSALASAYNSIS